MKGALELGCLPRAAPEPLSLQAGSYYLHLRAGFADGADGVHTEGDVLSSEVIAGGVVLGEPDDAHDSVDELDHQDGCKERQVLTKSYRLLSATREGRAQEPHPGFCCLVSCIAFSRPHCLPGL